ncbi:F0F1 ATP synthase subunit B [Boudabousia marimammalium]|uniref:ATP synthase subunit b n=1 Tax=Boudabousia marimammalium TaxID=156892 RepID=A0A1Q5PS23_9ACTO|nr:F0F1 ATP synthase subunit B [Boudabousia marimammalium]OKL50371.1 ATP synthase F0 subunit B [Boudabousia marimammalium]
MTLVRAAADGATHNPLLPHTYDLVWGVVAFLPFLYVMLRYVMPKFRTVLDERSETIQQGIDEAEEARVSLARARQDAEAIREEGHREAAEIRTRANDEASRIIAEAKQQAVLEAQRIDEVARAQINAEREAALKSLRTDVGGLATELAEKIVGEQLRDQDLTNRVIDRFLDDLENELAMQEA